MEGGFVPCLKTCAILQFLNPSNSGKKLFWFTGAGPELPLRADHDLVPQLRDRHVDLNHTLTLAATVNLPPAHFHPHFHPHYLLGTSRPRSPLSTTHPHSQPPIPTLAHTLVLNVSHPMAAHASFHRVAHSPPSSPCMLGTPQRARGPTFGPPLDPSPARCHSLHSVSPRRSTAKIMITVNA